MLNIFEALAKRKATKLDIYDVKKEISTDGSDYVYYRLILTNPIDEVEGKSMHHNALSGKKEPYVAYDVTEIRVHHDTMELHQEEICKSLSETSDGRIEGIYEGDLFLDVSSSDNVWLTYKTLNRRYQEESLKKSVSKFRRPRSNDSADQG